MKRFKNSGGRVVASLVAILVMFTFVQSPVYATESSNDVAALAPGTENEAEPEVPEIGDEVVDDFTEPSVNDSTVVTLPPTSPANSMEAKANLDNGNWGAHKASDFNGGDGSATSPYKIGTAEQLSLLAYQVNNGNTYANKHFQLENDIDLSAYRWVPIGLFKWEENGNTINKPFSGSFDGNNKTISGLNVDERTDKNSAGFFGYVTDKGVAGVEPVIKNLTISGASIYANEEGLMEAHSGILAGRLMVNQGSSVTISNVTVSGTINNSATDGNFQSGGIAGYAVRVKFTNCNANNVEIEGASNTGGFVGNELDSEFVNCHATGSVSGSWTLGGFVGYSTATSPLFSYSKCSADVNITGSDWRLGGFVGFLEGGNIKNCIAYGDVTSSVDGWEPKTGGFVGENNGTIEFSYAEGTITNAHPTIKAGGFVGFDNEGTTKKCMFDKTINATLSSISTIGTAGTNDIKEGTTKENKIGICVDILDGHKIDTSIWLSDEEEHWHKCSVCEGKFDNVAHDPSTEWSKDETNHWHECTTDGYKMDEAVHTFGDWVIDTPATETKKGSKHRDCSVCAQRETVEISATAVKPTPPAKPDVTPGKPSTPQTGDTANATPFILLIVSSILAAGYVLFRKVKVK